MLIIIVLYKHKRNVCVAVTSGAAHILFILYKQPNQTQHCLKQTHFHDRFISVNVSWFHMQGMLNLPELCT